MSTPFRRIVTGHDDQGRAIIAEAGPPPKILKVGDRGSVFYEVWNTAASPAPIRAGAEEPVGDDVVLKPPPNGTRLRVVEFPPNDRSDVTPEQARAAFASFGGADALDKHGAGNRHPMMHRTQTIDYGIVLEGEIVLLMDEGEEVCRAGDIVIQRGTNHAWVNRSGAPCRIAFILIDGVFEGGLA